MLMRVARAVTIEVTHWTKEDKTHNDAEAGVKFWRVGVYKDSVEFVGWDSIHSIRRRY